LEKGKGKLRWGQDKPNSVLPEPSARVGITSPCAKRPPQGKEEIEGRRKKRSTAGDSIQRGKGRPVKRTYPVKKKRGEGQPFRKEVR